MLDFHSHILPGLDDGAPDMDTALEMARIAVADGITEMVATPHYIEGSMENGIETTLSKVEEFQRALDEQSIPLKVFPGAEIYLSPETSKLLVGGELMTVNNKGKYLLVELPMQNVPDYVENILFELKVSGVTPIIAHPERNLELASNPNLILELVLKGYLLQINSGSVKGLYGKQVRKTAQLLIRNGLVHLVGSDAHSMGERSPKVREAMYITERLKHGQREKIADCGNIVLIGGEVTPESPTEFLDGAKGLWCRIKSVF